MTNNRAILLLFSAICFCAHGWYESEGNEHTKRLEALRLEQDKQRQLRLLEHLEKSGFENVSFRRTQEVGRKNIGEKAEDNAFWERLLQGGLSLSVQSK